ncbi:universal stress protein [Halopiger xanaduensis]|uniref:UspA domain-containing protein n=1 Tax=Halopiger xanaduensis (strain DSM 18323 / JCM 14033 / SH-6) TaxID=797210 RepID=F8DE91_HALXS|nr:universal stress protein [Halopiger xanaduensis]AEH39373.1 UspA domain-containing protein [Halopiger xanaduensis SH-6]
MYDRILVPTDGSTHADAAADTALELATALDATVAVVCIVETGLLGSVSLPGDGGSAEDVLGEQAAEFVEEIADRARARDVSVTSDIRQGVPVREILEYAGEVDADVIVMGSRGRGGVSRMLLGSVTEGVTRHSDRDVLVVGRDGTDIATGDETDFES